MRIYNMIRHIESFKEFQNLCIQAKLFVPHFNSHPEMTAGIIGYALAEGLAQLSLSGSLVFTSGIFITKK